MPSLSAAQLAILYNREREIVHLIEVGLPTPLRYCYPHELPTPYGGNLYSMRQMNLKDISAQSIAEAQWSIEIFDDADQTLAASWNANVSDWDDATIIYRQLGRLPGMMTWVEMMAILWATSSSEYDEGVLKLDVSGAGGVVPSYSLLRGSYDVFEFAPDSTKPVLVGGRPVMFPSGARDSGPDPGGDDPPYTGPRRGTGRNADPVSPTLGRLIRRTTAHAADDPRAVDS